MCGKQLFVKNNFFQTTLGFGKFIGPLKWHLSFSLNDQNIKISQKCILIKIEVSISCCVQDTAV